MTREIDITITLTYDYEPAEPEVNLPHAEIKLDEDGLIAQATEAAWENEALLSEDYR